jgi:hypothetical protein
MEPKSNDENPESCAIRSARTPVTVAPSSTVDSHCGVTSAMPDGTSAAVAPAEPAIPPEVILDLPKKFDAEQLS